MSTKLVVDDHSQLQEVRIPEFEPQPAWLKIIAKVISIIFHPLFIPVYVSVFLVYIQSYFFSSLRPIEQKLLIPRFIVIYSVFPLVSVLLLKGLNFINSIQLKTQKERIIPYVICMVYYFGHWYFLKKEQLLPPDFILFTAAIFFACIGGFLANIVMKISMHTIAAGVMIAFVILLAFSQTSDFGIYVSVALVIAGLVCTARLIVSDHTQPEVYAGLIVGIAAQLIAKWFS